MSSTLAVFELIRSGYEIAAQLKDQEFGAELEAQDFGPMLFTIYNYCKPHIFMTFMVNKIIKI